MARRRDDEDRSTGPTAPARGSLAKFAFALALAAALPSVAALAQSSAIPGLVVTTTPPPAPAPMPGRQVAPPAPQSAPPPQASAAKPKPKPTPKKEASVATGSINDARPGGQGIAALVNDEPITVFEVEERARFMTLTVDFTERAKANMKVIAENPKTNERLQEILKETIAANPGKTREQVIAAFEERKKAYVISLQQQAVASAKSSFVPGLKKKALEELIEERLKFQEAKKLSVTVADDEAEKAFKGIAEKNKMTSEQFAAHIKSQGADAQVMKARFKASMVWREVIRRRYGHQINISVRDVDRIAAAASTGEGGDIELQLHKITLGTAGKADQAVLAQRYAEAEALRQKFAGCKTTGTLARGDATAKFEDMGYRKASTVAEPTRSMLLSTNDGAMIPAVLTSSGAELYAVCGRRAPKIDDQKRQAAENELQMKEFERLAQRHLADLRKDALIEIR
jgi:peptidyl-prolyl cis-trans isomerase SurA